MAFIGKLPFGLAPGMGLNAFFVYSVCDRYDDATLVTLGEITSGSALLALIGLIITGSLYARNVPGAILIGILVTMVIGIPMGVTE